MRMHKLRAPGEAERWMETKHTLHEAIEKRRDSNSKDRMAGESSTSPHSRITQEPWGEKKHKYKEQNQSLHSMR